MKERVGDESEIFNIVLFMVSYILITGYSILLVFLAHQHKATGRKTRLDIQNYGCNGNFLCYHGAVSYDPIDFVAVILKVILVNLLADPNFANVF